MSASQQIEEAALVLPPARSRKTDDDLSEVMATNDDALLAKHSCATRGFFHDPFVGYFARPSSGFRRGDEHRPRVSPLIHRGYFSRVVAIRLLVERFLRSGERAQVVNFGAGSDTSYFYFAGLARQLGVALRWADVDLPAVIGNKIAVIRRTPPLSDLVGAESAVAAADPSTTLVCPSYAALAADLRDTAQLSRLLVDPSSSVFPMRRDVPTLFLSECVLIYLHADQGSDVIRWASDNFDAAAFVCYEQILPHDAFGRMMVTNLQERGCPLRSIAAYPTIDDQKCRYTSRGFSAVHALDMLDVYNKFIPQEEKTRANRLELFDEMEEWVLIQRHYCLVVAFSSLADHHATYRSALQFI